MSETSQRILVSIGIALAVVVLAVLEHWGIPSVRYAGVLVALCMIAETARCLYRAPRDIFTKGHNTVIFGMFVALLVLVLFSAWAVGSRPWIMLLLLITICGADIGGWLFGRILGGDKMWENLSAHKTWSGQIAGILCGTLMAVMYGLLGTGAFMPQLMWIGIGVSLMSQYGDLTASMIKRRLGIKDFSHILPGHGGITDRFDGWIYVLPLIWLAML